MIICIENTKGFTKPASRIGQFSKVAGYKVTVQKSILFLDTSNKQLETVILKNYHL